MGTPVPCKQPRKAREIVFISHKIDFKAKHIIRGKEGQFLHHLPDERVSSSGRHKVVSGYAPESSFQTWDVKSDDERVETGQ